MEENHHTEDQDDLKPEEGSLERNPLVADSEWHDIPECCGAWIRCLECKSCALEEGCRIVTGTEWRGQTPTESEWI